MTNDFDIFNPKISKVVKGIEGKVFLFYGDNSTGKTYQSARFPKPFYLPFEVGHRAINGIPYQPIKKWSDFRKLNKQLTSPKTVEKAKEVYSTIIFDEVFQAAQYCQDYICELHGAESIKSGNGGYGLWSEYAKEWRDEFNKLTNAGYTLIFIGHEQVLTTEEGQPNKIIPKGDPRSMQVVRDQADIIAYLKNNGTDPETHKALRSSAFFADTPYYFARSRFEYITPYLKEFTAENLERAVIEAVEIQEEKEGIKSVTYQEQVEDLKGEVLDFDAIMNEVKKIGKEMVEADRLTDFQEVVDNHLGKGFQVTKCEKSQVQVLSVILDDLRDLA